MEEIFRIKEWSIKKEGYTIYLCNDYEKEPLRETTLCSLGLDTFKRQIFDALDNKNITRV